MSKVEYNRESVEENVKLLTGENNDRLVKLLVKKAEQTIVSIAHIEIDEFTNETEDIIEDISILRYNQMGREGFSSESFGRNNISLSNELPAILRQKIYSLRTLRVI